MALIKNNHQKKLKFFLISIIFITCSVILSVFVGYRHISDKGDRLVYPVKSKANISIGKAHQTATRNGIKEWSLDAASADYMNHQEQVIFHDLSLTFFLKDNTKVYVTADQGILKTESNDMELSDNVVVKNKDYRLGCENLHYQHNRKIIFSKVPVNITGTSFNLVADSMRLNLKTNRTVFKGRVKGTLSEKITL